MGKKRVFMCRRGVHGPEANTEGNWTITQYGVTCRKGKLTLDAKRFQLNDPVIHGDNTDHLTRKAMMASFFPKGTREHARLENEINRCVKNAAKAGEELVELLKTEDGRRVLEEDGFEISYRD
jgi:hypothetical protein